MKTNTKRSAQLRRLLNTRRDAARDELAARLRDGRSGRSHGEGDDVDVSEARAQSELDLALLQMTSDTLARIDAALVRIDAGEYGDCVECGGGISDERLRALPFAARCRACEDQREQKQQATLRTSRGGGLAVLSDRVVF
jgi:DnaK suppressor protein